MNQLSDLELEDRLDSLKTKKKELKRQMFELDTQIIGYEEQKRQRKLDLERARNILGDITGEE